MIDTMQALLRMLEHSERMSLQALNVKQEKQCAQLLLHAKKTVPYYHDHPNSNRLLDWPVLTRQAIQYAGDDFISQTIPESHGQYYPLETSGSTGETVRVLSTDFTQLFYDALMLREHAWHQRDVKQKLMSIRWLGDREQARAPEGQVQNSWGPPIAQYYPTGPSVLINISSRTEDQINALLLHQPAYLLTYPSQLQALLDYCVFYDLRMPFIQEIRTTGEVLSSAHKDAVQRLWPQAKITDVYSCVEIGNIAHQCPEHQHYHVNAEHVHLEILNHHNKPCDIGETGRVVVTSLLNYATPLIRYELGDYAAFGESCPCGRTLPVLKHISGRTRNRLTLPCGETRFPYLGGREEIADIAPLRIQKFQFIQHSLEHIEIKVVTPDQDQITADDEAAFKALYQKILGYTFNIQLSYHDEIKPGASGKFEEFISLIA